VLRSARELAESLEDGELGGLVLVAGLHAQAAELLSQRLGGQQGGEQEQERQAQLPPAFFREFLLGAWAV
jgi:hypothetical protein